ncbi:porin [Chitinibacteraceae bacterium HSL-7]
MKKLIAFAVAAAFTAPFAMAEATIGGSVRSALDYVDYSGTSTAAGQFRIADQSSRIYFRIEDKLDNGSSLVMHIENRFNVGVGSSNTSWGSRNTYIGYKGDFGFLSFGKNDNAYKVATGDYLKALDSNFNDDYSYFGSSQILRRLGDRQDQLIRYDSPSWGGFKFRASYNLDAGKTDTQDATTAAVTASYSTKMFALGGAYAYAADQSKIGTVAVGSDTTGYQVGGSLFLGDFSLSAVWERLNFDNGTTDEDQDSYGVGAQYKAGKWTFHGYYAAADDRDNHADSGAQQYGVGAQYSLTKQSRVYLTYGGLDNDLNAKFKTEAPGLTVANGTDMDIVSFGVRSDF